MLTFFSRTNDGFWTLGLDSGTGRGEEAGAFHGWMGLFTYWLQKDLILAGEQQALEADKALLEWAKTQKNQTEGFSVCQVPDHLQPENWTRMDEG